MIKHYFELLKNSIFYGTSKWISTFVGILVIPIITRYLLPSEFGSVTLALIFASIVSLLIIFGMDNSIAYYLNFSDGCNRKIFASTSLFFVIILLLFYSCILFFFSKNVSEFIFHENSVLVYCIIFLIPLNVFFLYFQNLLIWNHRLKQYLILSIGYSLSFLLLIFLFILIFHAGLLGVLSAYLISYLLFALFGYMATRDLFILKFDFKKCKVMLKYGSPFVVVGIVSNLLAANDKIFLSVLSNLSETGIYTIGVGLSSALSLITSGFQTALGPFAFKNASNPESKKIYKTIFLYYSYIISFFWLALVMFSKEVLMILVPDQYIEAYVVVPFLAGGIIMTGFLNIFCLSAGITKNTHFIAISSISGLFLNVILMFFLIPSFGIVGAASATFMSSLLSSLIMNILGQRIFYIEYDYKRAGLILSIAFGLGFLSLLLYAFPLLLCIVIKIVLLAIFGIFILRLFGFDKNTFTDLQNFLKTKT